MLYTLLFFVLNIPSFVITNRDDLSSFEDFYIIKVEDVAGLDFTPKRDSASFFSNTCPGQEEKRFQYLEEIFPNVLACEDLIPDFANKIESMNITETIADKLNINPSDLELSNLGCGYSLSFHIGRSYIVEELDNQLNIIPPSPTLNITDITDQRVFETIVFQD